MDYKTHAENDSMYNTPPTYGIYIAGLVFRWIKAQGGLSAMAERNSAKAGLLYDYLDASAFFKSSTCCGTFGPSRSRDSAGSAVRS